MDPRVHALAATFRLNSRLFLNCLRGVEDGAGLRRPTDQVNNLTFIAVHDY